MNASAGPMGEGKSRAGAILRIAGLLGCLLFIASDLLLGHVPVSLTPQGVSQHQLRAPTGGQLAWKGPEATRICLLLPSKTPKRKDGWSVKNAREHMALAVTLESFTNVSSPGFEYLVLVGHDGDDHFFADPILQEAFFARAAEIVSDRKVAILLRPLHALGGRVTAIYNALAEWGFDIGCDYLIPGNDDTMWFTPGWTELAMTEFASRAPKGAPCPNFGVVAFNDLWFPNFPTFNMVNRLHLHIFNRVLYPIPLPGAHSDPWIWHLYVETREDFALLHKGIVVKNHVKDSSGATTEGSRFDYTGATHNDAAEMNMLREAINLSKSQLEDWLTTKLDCCTKVSCSKRKAGEEVRNGVYQ